mmetsp:Transcript_1724/g.2677  ORF Transcript_1724/g.2677 Transcript_1724/m.2677 type:complete len:138 (+) Transcript_1724:990-1403(+)
MEQTKKDTALLGMSPSESLLMNHPNVITATMVSLCGLRCHQDVVDLYNTVLSPSISNGSNSSHMLEYENCETSFWKDSLDDCFTYAQDMISEEESYDDVDENNETNIWRTASKHLHRLSTVLHSVPQKEGDGYNVFT